MTNRENLNLFIAETVLEMDDETRAAWDFLSDFERKTIAFAAWTARNIKRRQAFEDTRWNIRHATLAA